MTWVSISPQAPEGITQTVQAVVSSLGVLQTSLQAVKVEAQANALLATSTESAAVTAANAAIQGVISTINAALDAVLDDTGLFLLPIPLPKRGVARLSPFGGIDADQGFGNGNETGSNLIEYPVNNILARASTSEREIFESSPLLRQILAPVDLIVGGNAHILKTISDALFDQGDANRPRFSSNETFAYALFMAGASNVSNLLNVAAYFDRLIGGVGSANHVGSSRGLSHTVPQGVRVSPSGRTNFAIIEWDLTPASTVLGSFDASTVYVNKYAVIRSTDLRARGARSVQDLFPTAELTEGLQGVYGAKVLKVAAYDGVVTRYVDTENLTANTTYYYHVAFSTRVDPGIPPIGDQPDSPLSAGVVDGEAVPQLIGFGPLSSAVQFQKPTRRDQYSGRGLSRAPDFIRTPSVVSLVPALNGIVDYIQAYAGSLASRVQNTAVRNQQLIYFLDREIQRYGLLIDQINAKLTQIQNFFTLPDSAAGIYGTLRSGSGGATSFIADIAAALSDGADENTPPFRNGDEFTTGVLMLAVGPNPAPILAAFELLKSLLTPSTSDDPALAGIRSINTQLAEAEADLVNQITGGTNAVLNPSITFNTNMTPRAAGAGDATCDPT